MNKNFSFYKIICIATSILFVYLTFQLLFLSDAFILSLGQKPSEATSVLAHRAAMFMFGISVLMFGARNLTPSNARQIICLATGITLAGLSCMGWYEFFRGTVNSSIFIAISIETTLWVSFSTILLKNRKPEISKQ
jgi:hypothetical protein